MVQELTFEPMNEVRLRGKLSAPVELRLLPSGDEIAVWRLVVPRADATSGAVDTIDCECYSRRVTRQATTWVASAIIEVEGCVRRRFWQSPGGARSRYTVDVRSARKAGR